MKEHFKKYWLRYAIGAIVIVAVYFWVKKYHKKDESNKPATTTPTPTTPANGGSTPVPGTSGDGSTTSSTGVAKGQN